MLCKIHKVAGSNVCIQEVTGSAGDVSPDYFLERINFVQEEDPVYADSKVKYSPLFSPLPCPL